MDPVQAVLLFVIVIITILLIVLGIQVFFVLRELRTGIRQAKRVLQNTESITESISEPISFLSNLTGNATTLSTIAHILKIFTKKDKKE